LTIPRPIALRRAVSQSSARRLRSHCATLPSTFATSSPFDEWRSRPRSSATTHKGNRPSFAAAASPEIAGPLYERFCQTRRELGVAVERGVFGARMEVEVVNDGPVTIVLE
jgi:hypothetical protein